ncbi:NAD(P)-dependent dehydrogenase (short-subunit alcohol dehydrogenase family) [Sphingobium sp. OAS761]|uniref:SDR family NAD(P)-dependent oxidoreductase n=1 Tax=Sphingobium sp. OAS761 TaxID=2817901 RepID=UPI00209F9907|nr:SDR family oxidoreductase [Sphingobium sp. OAS761]MCP1471784.1 NAD(P)-dependent dehydrogenase (short-subunit alcohol dehydrogenase family) [Sphingobium sp. OAS761]
MTMLTNRTAFVTGASGAIATACAIALAADGARLALMARRADALDEARAAIRDAVPDAQITPILGDCGDEAAVKAAIGQAHGIADRLDIALATVGGGGFVPFMMLQSDMIRETLETNLLSAFFVIRHAVPLMAKGGSIVCTSSSSATLTFPYLSAYHIAKSALEGMVRAAADELGGTGIRINAVRPGLTRARGTAGLVERPEVLDQFLDDFPLRRVGEPDDIARAVRFLAGPESGWITGECLSVDGGNHLRGSPDLTPMVEAIYGKPRVDKARAGKDDGE